MVFENLFAAAAGTAPAALFSTAVVLMVARLRQDPWPWKRAAAAAALASALLAILMFAVLAAIFADGMGPLFALVAAAGGAAQGAIFTGLVAGGARVLERHGIE